MPTHEIVGIELVDGRSLLVVDNQVAYGFTWRQPGGIWLGYQILFPLDRYQVSLSVADIAPTDDQTLTERNDTSKASAEEITSQYLEQFARILSQAGLPFTSLPMLDASPLIQGQEPETEDQKRADISSPWSYEQGGDVEFQLLIYGTPIDRRSKPDKATCNEAFVNRSYSEDKTIRSCDGYGVPKESQNDVCKEAAKNAGKMAANISYPPDCARREETEIGRGWRCFEGEPERPVTARHARSSSNFSAGRMSRRSGKPADDLVNNWKKYVADKKR